jgi:hypothetical protein
VLCTSRRIDGHGDGALEGKGTPQREGLPFAAAVAGATAAPASIDTQSTASQRCDLTGGPYRQGARLMWAIPFALRKKSPSMAYWTVIEWVIVEALLPSQYAICPVQIIGTEHPALSVTVRLTLYVPACL